jgi:integrase
MRSYLMVRPPVDTDRLWVTDEGIPLSYWGGQSIMRRLKERLEVEGLGFHKTRHTFIQNSLDKGATPGEAREMAGHHSDAMRRYMRVMPRRGRLPGI